MFKFCIIVFLFCIRNLFADVCPPGMYKVRSHPRSSYYRTDGVFVSNTVVEDYCKNYRNEGPHQLKFLEKMPKNYPLKKEHFKKCNSENAKIIADVFSRLPMILTSIGKIDIYCADKSVVYPDNPASSFVDKKSIILYDQSFKEGIEKIIGHELSHFLWENLSSQEKASYYEIAQWREIKDLKLFVTNRDKFTATDGKTSPEEDFANNVEAFLFDQQNFENNFSKISNWIKTLIGKQNDK